jgi:lipoprotein NlpD
LAKRANQKVRDNLGMMPMNLKIHTSLPRSLSTFCSVLALALLATACGTKSPAPVVNRTGPGNQTPAPVVRAAPPVVAQVPAPAPAVVDTQTSPVRTGTIDNKPLEVKPLDKPPVITTSPAVNAASAASMIRTQPKGLKRPYSDTLLAELKAVDAPPAPVVVPPVVATAPTPVAAVSPPAVDAKSSQLGWPSTGKVTQGFGKDKSTGMSFSGKIGDPIASAADGKVIFSNTTLPQYGKMIIVKHDDDTHTVYAHNKTLLVKEGQQVKKGQKIAELGDSGATEPKLYFEVRSKGKPVDPQKLLPPR